MTQEISFARMMLVIATRISMRGAVKMYDDALASSTDDEQKYNELIAATKMSKEEATKQYLSAIGG